MCKHFPLQLLVFSERKYKREVTIEKTPVCEELCGYRKVKIKDLIGTVTRKGMNAVALTDKYIKKSWK